MRREASWKTPQGSRQTNPECGILQPGYSVWSPDRQHQDLWGSLLDKQQSLAPPQSCWFRICLLTRSHWFVCPVTFRDIANFREGSGSCWLSEKQAWVLGRKSTVSSRWEEGLTSAICFWEVITGFGKYKPSRVGLVEWWGQRPGWNKWSIVCRHLSG